MTVNVGYWLLARKLQHTAVELIWKLGLKQLQRLEELERNWAPLFLLVFAFMFYGTFYSTGWHDHPSSATPNDTSNSTRKRRVYSKQASFLMENELLRHP